MAMTLTKRLSSLGWEPFLALLLVGVVQFVTILNPGAVEVDPEEMYNAGHAFEVLNGHWDALFRLQYREYCGGCTLNALLGAGLFSFLPASWVVWKLVPTIFVLLLAGVGFLGLRYVGGRPMAWAFIALLLFPPMAWRHLSMIAWGNHLESGVLVFVGWVVLSCQADPSRRRLCAAGLLLGLAVWIGFSGVFACIGSTMWLMWNRRLRATGWLWAGIGLGVSPWLAQWLSAGQHPFVTIYRAGELLPNVSRAMAKIGTLVEPRQLVALFGYDAWPLGWALGWVWAAALVISIWIVGRGGRPFERGLLFLMASWLGVYLIVRFQISAPDAPQISAPGGVRYATPLYPLAFATLAAGFRIWWGRGWRKRAGALMAAALAAGFWPRMQIFVAGFPMWSIAGFSAVDHDYFRVQGSYVLSAEEHFECETTEPRSRQFHAYGLGRVLAKSPTIQMMDNIAAHGFTGEQERSFWEGVGHEIADHFEHAVPVAEREGVAGLLGVFEEVRKLEPSMGQARIAMRSAAWSWRGSGSAWAIDPGQMGVSGLRPVQVMMAEQPYVVMDAVFWTLGRKWGNGVVGFYLPKQVVFPQAEWAIPVDPNHQVSFAEGFGVGLGEEWGPQKRLERPVGLCDLGCEEALIDGFREGVTRRWLGMDELDSVPSPHVD